MKQENYSPELLTQIVSQHQAGVPIEEIAKNANKTVRSVRAKLVKENKYNAPEKPTSKKEGPTKKELLRDLEAKIEGFKPEQFLGVTKAGLSFLLEKFQ